MNAPIAEIVDFEPQHAADFKRLNLAWLEQHFRVETIDEEVLSRPGDILRAGGTLHVARSGDAVVGCCALIARGDGAYEVSKMAVTPDWQGQGLGRRLLEAVIADFDRLDGRLLFLETNAVLTTAIALYERAGFTHQRRPTPSPYARANVYMVRGA